MKLTQKDLPNIGINFKWKNCLTAEEIGTIIMGMKKYKTFIQREVLKSVLLVKLCTDIELQEDINDVEIYNLYTDMGLIPLLKENIVNYNLIDIGYQEETSFNVVINDFLKSVNILRH